MTSFLQIIFFLSFALMAISPVQAGNGLASIMSKQQFEQIFFYKNAFYTYESFLRVANQYPQFLSSKSDAVNQRELAALLGQISLNTDMLYSVEEIGNRAPTQYCDASKVLAPCTPGKAYYGAH